jgi:hypothetical protein
MGLLDTIEELAAATHAGVSRGESRDQVTVTG